MDIKRERHEKRKGKKCVEGKKDLGREKGCLEERVVTKAVYSGSAGKKEAGGTGGRRSRGGGEKRRRRGTGL